MQPKDASAYLPPRLVWDAVIGRLTYDRDFQDRLTRDPMGTFEAEGYHLSRAEVTMFIRQNPEVFKRMGRVLRHFLSPDFFHAYSAPARSLF